MESEGVTFKDAHKNLVNVDCAGLRYRGVRALSYVDEFHRFQCDLSGADNHYYIANVWITSSTGAHFRWQVTSITREF
jgi:hypothetical protein